MAFRILAMDGGGVRGVYAARLLHRLAVAAPGFLGRVDLFAGTSPGGILALGLARGMTPSDLVALYADNARDIFDDSWWDDIVDLGKVIGADYDNRRLRRLLDRTFGRATLGSLKKRVLIPAFDLDDGAAGNARTWKPKFFHNYPGHGSDASERIVDVAMRTSAAPTYFPSFQGYVDGGVVANNPSMAALAQAIDAGTGGQAIGDVRLLSIGTGSSPAYVEGQDLDWGFAQWARPLVALMIEGSMGVADYQCQRLLGASYHRLAPRLPVAVDLDAANRVRELVGYANKVDVAATASWIKATF